MPAKSLQGTHGSPFSESHGDESWQRALLELDKLRLAEQRQAQQKRARMN